MFKRLFIFLLTIAPTIGFSASAADIQKFQISVGRNKTCMGNNVNKTLILLDKTDELTAPQLAYVKAQFIDTHDWTDRGDTIGIAALTDAGVSLMKTETICAPPSFRENNGQINLTQVKKFKEALQQIYSELTKPEPKANQTNLYEAIVEVYRNPTFKFSAPGGNRKLIIVSDLFQNSSNINFYAKCSAGSGCPSFQSSLTSDTTMNSYLKMANLNLSEKDTIIIYQLQSRCKSSPSLSQWWKDAFMNAGLNSSKFEIQPELSGDCSKFGTKPNKNN